MDNMLTSPSLNIHPMEEEDQKFNRPVQLKKEQNPQSSLFSSSGRTPQNINSFEPSIGPIPQRTQLTTLTMEPDEIVPMVQNIVSNVNLGCPLDLKKIVSQVRNAEYNPKSFNAVIMRIREPRTTALVFSSGKMVCTGAKSEEDSRLAARKYARIIQKLGFPAKFKELTSILRLLLIVEQYPCIT